MVVNPKVVSCEYNLLTDGSMENLAEQINEIEDENERKKKLEQYDELRKNLESADGIPEILKQNVKKGGKYIVFIPVTENLDGTEIEDEDGNKTENSKTSVEKIEEYKRKISEYLRNSGIEPEYYSMLGAYSDKENERQLEGFESENSDKTKFMVVMNKANEGLHVKGVDGIIWFRALDENSRILYLQQLGRTITSIDPNNPVKDEDRPVVIDLTNNTQRVNIDKEMKNTNRKDDLELLTIVVDWVKAHGDNLPQVTSTSDQERKYAATLYRIQQKYIEYRNGIDEEEVTEEERKNIEKIIAKGEEIELWDRELEEIPKGKIGKILDVDSFEVKGYLHDFVELDKEVEGLAKRNTIDEFIEKLEKLQEIGVDVSKIVQGDTILSLTKKTLKEPEEILIQRIKGIGLNPDDKIGSKKNNIKFYYNKSQKGKKAKGIVATEAQVKRLKEMGVWEKNTIDEFIEKLEKLQEIGVDVSKIVQRDTILRLTKKTLEEPEKILIQRIKKIGLKPDDKIGSKISDIKVDYNKSQRGEDTGGKTIATEAQVKRLKEMGVWEKEEKNTIDEFIEKLEKLQEIGVDVSKIVKGDTILNLAKKTLEEPEEILIQRIKGIGLNQADKIGDKRDKIKHFYKAKQEGKDTSGRTIATEAQVKRIKEMGVWGREENTIDEFIEKLEKLQEIGVDVSKIVRGDTILRLTQKTLKEPEEILIQRIKGIGLNPDDKIGNKKDNIKFYYNKSQKGKDVVDRTIATEEQVEKIRSFGIKIGEEITGQSIGQASYTANVQECDDAQAKLNRLVQEQQTKEGGKH